MKKVFGWVGVVFLMPFIFAGVLAYFIADAVVFGWRHAEQWLEDWDA